MLGSTREVYCGLSRADRNAPISKKMKKQQWNVTRQTLQKAGFAGKLLAQTLFFQLWPMGYGAAHRMKERKNRLTEENRER